MDRNYAPILIEFYGKKYTAQRLGKRYQLSPSTIKYRYKKGMRGADLVEPPRDDAFRTEVAGHPYTLKELAQKYHLNLNTIKGRYRDGRRGKELVQEPTMIRVDLDGERYSLPELGRKFHINPATIHSRYQKGDRQWALVRPVAHRRFKSRTKQYDKIVLRGKHYSYRSLAQTSGISAYTIRRRYRAGIRGENLIRTPKRMTQSVRDPRTQEKTTIRRLSQKYHLNYGTLRNRYRDGDRGKSLIRPTKKILNQVTVQGEKYTFRELSQAYDISLNTILNRYYQLHLRGEELVRPIRWTTH